MSEQIYRWLRSGLIWRVECVTAAVVAVVLVWLVAIGEPVVWRAMENIIEH